MKPPRPPTGRRRRQRGVAAVEFAILVPALIVLLSAPLFIGRVLWHYTVVQKAAHDATRYLATVPEAEMRSSTLAPVAAALANDIVAAELADLYPRAAPPVLTIKCNGNTCGGATPWSTVGVRIEMELHDPFFDISYGGDDGMLITAEVQMNYIGTR
jgi:hypothetical protein